ncbi:MAG: hypothetical protein JST58_16670 [Bacteroidetes bacterium]|nr:hypothetical protein [Bacteroidota bacterium]
MKKLKMICSRLFDLGFAYRQTPLYVIFFLIDIYRNNAFWDCSCFRISFGRKQYWHNNPIQSSLGRRIATRRQVIILQQELASKKVLILRKYI